MQIHTFALGPVGTNGYLLVNEHNRGLFFDPGANSDKVLEFIETQQIHIEGILITHAHFDHIGGLEQMRKRTGAPVYIHSKENSWLSDPLLNGSGLPPWTQFVPTTVCNPADVLLEQEGEIQIGEFKIQLLYTPGHSPGSLSYYIDNFVICGDTLFKNGIGRTDLREGSYSQLMSSITDKLLQLPDETVIYPGHGGKSTIGDEKRENPFLENV